MTKSFSTITLANIVMRIPKLTNTYSRRYDYNNYYRTRFHMMIMEELPEQRPTYVLKRGLYSTPDLNAQLSLDHRKKSSPSAKNTAVIVLVSQSGLPTPITRLLLASQ